MLLLNCQSRFNCTVLKIRCIYSSCVWFFNSLVLSLHIIVNDRGHVTLERILERIRSIDRGVSVNFALFILVGGLPRCRTRFQPATLPEQVQFGSFLEWVLLNSALHLIRVALDCFVADVQVLLYIETIVKVD